MSHPALRSPQRPQRPGTVGGGATAVCAVLAALLVTAHAARCAEWPCFHGALRDNQSRETGLLGTWPEGGPPLLWTAAGLGVGYSSVAVSGGRVFTAGMTDGQTAVIALDANGGALLWRRNNGASWDPAPSQRFARGYAGSRGTPTVDGAVVYHLGETGSLTAYAAATGEVVWHKDLLQEFAAEVPKYGFAESILVDADRLYVAPGGKEGFLACLDKHSGSVVWANREIQSAPGYCSPILAEFGGKRQVITLSAEEVLGLDAATGRLLWRAKHGNPRLNNATDAIFHAGHVFATSGYGKGSVLLRLAGEGEALTAQTVWSTTTLDNHHGGVVLVDGFLYGAGHESKGWHCLEFATGKPAWSAPGKGALTVADGRLYCLDERGTLTLVAITPEAYRPAGSFTVPSGGKGLHWSHPVVSGGRLYTRHADCLFVYDLRAQ